MSREASASDRASLDLASLAGRTDGQRSSIGEPSVDAQGVAPSPDFEVKRLLVLDLFAGTGSSTQAFVDAGHRVITVELDPQFEATHTMSVLDVTADWFLAEYGVPDFIWASPPCTAFSVASIGHHWDNSDGTPKPKTEAAAKNQELVRHAIDLARQLNPTYGWLLENPRGMLRKLDPVRGIARRTVTYCQYGDTRMKPTDLWGSVAGWKAKPACKNGDTCHEPAPRGSRTGTQGIAGARDRSRVPYALGAEILAAITNGITILEEDIQA